MIRNQTVTRLRAPIVTDAYGNRIRDWDNPAPATIAGCSVQPGLRPGESGVEEDVDRQTTVTRLRLYAPAEADIEPTDRIESGGLIYDVDGPVARWPSPYGAGVHHVEAALKRVEG